MENDVAIGAIQIQKDTKFVVVHFQNILHVKVFGNIYAGNPRIQCQKKPHSF